MQITKMHGLGNDFVVIEEQNVAEQNLGLLAKKICTRKLNVGADGLIVVCDSNVADVRMRIFNSDGSEAEMCGNGIRCFSKYVYEHGLVSSESLSVETLAGIMYPVLEVKDGMVVSVKVNMGHSVLAAKDIPVREDKSPQNFEIDVEGKKFNISAVLVGVPHAVVFVDSINLDEVVQYGALIEKHVVFPKNTNVDFVRIINDSQIEIRTWERGAGLTLACGTGSCASAVAANLRGFCGNTVEVQHKVGNLIIEIKDGNVFMTGPAETVFSGEWFCGGKSNV